MINNLEKKHSEGDAFLCQTTVILLSLLFVTVTLKGVIERLVLFGRKVFKEVTVSSLQCVFYTTVDVAIIDIFGCVREAMTESHFPVAGRIQIAIAQKTAVADHDLVGIRGRSDKIGCSVKHHTVFLLVQIGLLEWVTQIGHLNCMTI